VGIFSFWLRAGMIGCMVLFRLFLFSRSGLCLCPFDFLFFPQDCIFFAIYFSVTSAIQCTVRMFSGLRSAANRLRERWSPRKAFDQAKEGIKDAATSSTEKAKETAFHAVQRTRDTVAEASKRAGHASKEYARAKMDAAKRSTLRSVESAKKSSVGSLESAKQSARTFVERAKQSTLRAPRRASRVAHKALGDSATAAKEYASTKMESARQLVESATPSFRWLWWWSLAAVGVYGLAVSIPREVRVAIENRRKESVQQEGEK
jgi:vacuolar-type H+-ATPase subunit H